jgi:two-component system response regulator NreC
MSIDLCIVDDHAVFRSGLKALLEKEPDLKVVAEAGDGHDALKLLEKVKVDVFLLDITLPGISGTQLAELTLERHPKMAIVVLTMHEDEYYLQELFRVGIRGYILKKSTGAEVISAIRAAYRGDTYVDPALAQLIVSPYVGITPAKDEGRLGLLSDREQEVCGWLAHGFTNNEVAEKLCISPRTVETHRIHIMHKLGLKTRAELVRFSIDHGLLKMS